MEVLGLQLSTMRIEMPKAAFDMFTNGTEAQVSAALNPV